MRRRDRRWTAAAGAKPEAAQEAAMSRLYGGIHFREDNDEGLDLGRKVGQVVVDNLKRNGTGI